jgi:hypothetical protein
MDDGSEAVAEWFGAVDLFGDELIKAAMPYRAH